MCKKCEHIDNSFIDLKIDSLFNIPSYWSDTDCGSAMLCEGYIAAIPIEGIIILSLGIIMLIISFKKRLTK